MTLKSKELDNNKNDDGEPYICVCVCVCVRVCVFLSVGTIQKPRNSDEQIYMQSAVAMGHAMRVASSKFVHVYRAQACACMCLHGSMCLHVLLFCVCNVLAQ